MTIPTRGLRHVRTLSGASDESLMPYRAYMKISCLEQEKIRRGRERDRALRWVEQINVRLAEIEIEKEKLLAIVGQEGTPEPPPKPAAKKARSRKKADKRPEPRTRSTLQWGADGLRLRY